LRNDDHADLSKDHGLPIVVLAQAISELRTRDKGNGRPLASLYRKQQEGLKVMDAAELQESTRRLLEEPLLEGQDLDTKVRLLLRSEYSHRLARYRHVDRLMAGKYGVQFDEFVSRRVVKEEGFSWDVESDAMNWETAIGGIRTMERKLRELHETEHV
jgi:hypothetical protein